MALRHLNNKHPKVEVYLDDPETSLALPLAKTPQHFRARKESHSSEI